MTALEFIQDRASAQTPGQATQFSLEHGSNEGCYITINHVEYRLNCVSGKAATELYKLAVMEAAATALVADGLAMLT